MSDPVMLPFHLPETYISAVKAAHSAAQQQQGNDRRQDNPFTKAVFGWLFPSSVFEADHQDNCEQGSVETERTVENDWDDDDDDDVDWDDTYSIDSSNDEASSVSEENGDSHSHLPSSLDEYNGDWDDTYNIRSNDDGSSITVETNRGLQSCSLSFSLDEYHDDDYDEGHFYFNPSLQDFPRAQGPTTRPQEEVQEDVAAPGQQIFDDNDSSHVRTRHNVWVAFGSLHSLDKGSSFNHDSFDYACKKGEEVCQRGEIFVHKAPRTEDVARVSAASPSLLPNTMAPPISHSQKRALRKNKTKTCSRDKQSKGRRRSKSDCRDGQTKKRAAKAGQPSTNLVSTIASICP
eukprot:CAMPEP_0202507818 /NCGR_PEP_ID=MMETSP1361-20130828/51926_1 /ASSEMBLY_ACC=CAM_ASM_000849 /TAXON_ID=210615 /ORGANISM="Staurosira complex sp., Strain CCMP2646" /LENGTH=346 /DNA_ID=CAMNT_0049141965 /DNA_START=295 /DNA_END=1335 /DNA_ORIENTATION=+